jgi:DNA-binding NtrC family response regulator
VYPIIIPSLHERSDDIPVLAERMLQKFSAQQKKSITSFEQELMDFIRKRQWTGNIRELENFVERLVTLASFETATLSREILPSDLIEDLKRGVPAHAGAQTRKSLEESLAEHEELLIRQALIKNNWNQSQAARDLKLQVQTLRYKMKKLGIEKPQS